MMDTQVAFYRGRCANFCCGGRIGVEGKESRSFELEASDDCRFSLPL